MAELLTDGTISWIGGMDTSRSPSEIDESQYSKAANVILPDSLGGIRSRFGIHCCSIKFESEKTKSIYENEAIEGEGWFSSGGRIYLIAVVSGYVIKFTKTGAKSYYAECVNENDRNININSSAWVIRIPNGCIVNNGFDFPLIVTEDSQRRSKPDIGEIGIGRMGVYVQNRLFYVDQSGKQIIASDFNQPFLITREGTNIFGFACPDADETITAIGRQKSILGGVEGGNLIWSSDKDIYSVDVRGTRSQWADLGQSIGKVTETIPGFSAISSESFESFNSNIYFRSVQFGMADIKQSQYQFVNLDAVKDQAIEASYYLSNDTDWMLHRCYTRACNGRLYTTVTPELTDKGTIYWNGILSFHPSAIYASKSTVPRRFESVFTGVRPACLTVVSTFDGDTMFIHSFDDDGKNRLYQMDERSDFDIDKNGNVVEIEGFIETRAYQFKNPFLLKTPEKRLYRLAETERSIKLILFSRPDTSGEWIEFWNTTHLICRDKKDKNGFFEPVVSRPQTRSYVIAPSEKFSCCHKQGNKFLSMQYRIEFKGPLNFEFIALVAKHTQYDITTTNHETECSILTYGYRPDYGYSINTQPI